MKKLSIPRIACVLGLAFACMLVFAGCAQQSSNSVSSTGAPLTGGVAATVNGVEIPEDDVTTAIEDARSSMGLTDEAAWGEWLAEQGETPQSIREQMIDSLVNREIIRQGAENAGVTVDSSEVDSYVDRMKANYDDDQAWKDALASAGLTEEEYRENLEYSIKAMKVQDTLDAAEPTDDELISSLQTYLPSFNGAKRSSHILFDANDEATAQQVLDQLNSGELDFAEAAKTYSKDTGSAENGGDVGWDALTTFVSEYTEGLNNLETGQISGLVPSTYGIHIIKCTDTFNAPEQVTSLDQVPSEFVDNVRSMMEQSNKSMAFSDWLEEQRNALEVIVNDAPEGLTYMIDMTPYQTADSATGTDGTISADGLEIEGATTDGTGTEGSTEGSVEGTQPTQ